MIWAVCRARDIRTPLRSDLKRNGSTQQLAGPWRSPSPALVAATAAMIMSK